MFGEECVDFSEGKDISVTVDGKTVHICLETRVRIITEQNIRGEGLLFLIFLSSSSPLISRCATRMTARRMTH